MKLQLLILVLCFVGLFATPFITGFFGLNPLTYTIAAMINLFCAKGILSILGES